MQHLARHHNSEPLEHTWECGYMQRNTRRQDRFLEHLLLHQIKADKFFKSHKGNGRAFVNMGQLEETGRRGWAV